MLPKKIQERIDELEKQLEEYRIMVDSTPDLLYRTDMEGRIIFASGAVEDLSGYTVEEAIGMKMAEEVYLHPEDRINFLELLQQKGYVRNFLALLKRKDGSVWWVSTNAHFYRDENGTILGVEGVTRNVDDLKKAEEALQKAHHKLEQRVIDRTDLLKQKTERLLETNIALKVLLEKREEDKKDFEEKIRFNLEKLIYPYLEKLRMRCSEDFQQAFLKIIQTNLEEITSSFTQNHKNYLANLTPAQIQIADLIKQGHTTKEIASLLNLSPSTVACQRQAIRKRLSLTNKKTNLQAALTTNSQQLDRLVVI